MEIQATDVKVKGCADPRKLRVTLELPHEKAVIEAIEALGGQPVAVSIEPIQKGYSQSDVESSSS